MSNDPANQEPTVFELTGFRFCRPNRRNWLGIGLLSPPTRPGLLAVLSHYEVIRVLGQWRNGGVRRSCWRATR